MANYKVVFNPDAETGGGEEFEKELPSLEIAKAVEDALADYTLFLHKKGLMEDLTNYGFILIENENGDWEELEDSI